MAPSARSLVERPLLRLPGLYAWIISRRRHPNLEKIVYLRLVLRGDTVVDAGANTGYYTLLFSQLVGPRGRIHAFEPAPPTFAQLQASVRRSPHDNVTCNLRALAEEEKEAVLYLPGEDHGQASLTPHAFGSWAAGGPVHAHPCRATTLDAYAEAAGIDSLAFVKCDVEGAELPLLHGASRTIRRFQPLLFLEVSRHWTSDFGYEPADLAELVASLGYSRFFLVGDRVLPLSDLRRDLDPRRLPDSANLLCAVDSRHGRRLARLRPWLRPGSS